MAMNITSLRENIPQVPQNVLDQMATIEVSSKEFNFSLTIGLVVAILFLLIIITYVFIYRRQKKSYRASNSSSNDYFKSNSFGADYSKNDSLKSSFDESFEKGISFLNSKDFKSARLEYYNMKNIAEKSDEKKFIDKTLDFYKKYEGALNEKK